MAKSWSEQQRQYYRNRKAMERARQIRAAEARARHRRELVTHPVRSVFRSLFGR
jgi:hypothetical protein